MADFELKRDTAFANLMSGVASGGRLRRVRVPGGAESGRLSAVARALAKSTLMGFPTPAASASAEVKALLEERAEALREQFNLS